MGETNQQNGSEAVNKELSDKTDDKQNKPWLFKPGQSGNPAGRPKGRLSFSTIFDEAIKKIVEEKKIPIDDPEIEMVTKAVIEALKGNYAYYRDTMDRKYGKAPQPLEIGNADELPFIINIVKDEPKREDNQVIPPAV